MYYSFDFYFIWIFTFLGKKKTLPLVYWFTWLYCYTFISYIMCIIIFISSLLVTVLFSGLLCLLNYFSQTTSILPALLWDALVSLKTSFQSKNHFKLPGSSHPPRTFSSYCIQGSPCDLIISINTYIWIFRSSCKNIILWLINYYQKLKIYIIISMREIFKYRDDDDWKGPSATCMKDIKTK